MRFRVCRTDEVPEGEVRAFRVEALSVPILVANLGGELIAASGMCPHEDVELEGGDLEGETIICPGHAYEFNLRSGACDHDPDLCLPTYDVSIESGEVFISVLGARGGGS